MAEPAARDRARRPAADTSPEHGPQLRPTSLLAIINDILDFSKIEAGKLEVERLTFDLHGRSRTWLEMLLARSRAGKSSSCARAGSTGAALLRAGRPGTACRRSSSTWSATPSSSRERGEVVVEVDIWTRREAGCAAVRRARHRHRYRPDGLRAPVHSSFSQADDSTTRRFGGTGLGLAISRQLAELHGRAHRGGQRGRAGPRSGSPFR